MAVKLTSKKKIRSFDVGVEDETLNEVLSAGKTNLAYRNGEVVPRTTALMEDEELIIEKNPAVVSYEDVQERTVQYAIAHEDAKELKKKARRLTSRRFVETFVSIVLVILLGFLVMLLLYPQTEVSELARDNSNLKDEINTVKREIVNAEENANGIADMDVIRAQAIALGMQDPNQNQVINLPVPNTDSLRTKANYNSEGINDDDFNDSKDALADYYAAHPDK
ncbi:MAG: hypothetical protein IKG03_03710 [Clostridiales bacterium]|nr:hypothetical protein [Clostridiales bacterium]